MVERWLPVVGFEGAYEVSDQGRVRSLDRIMVQKNGSQHRLRGKVLRINGSGPMRYGAVALHAGFGGHTHYVHDLVLAAFKGPKPPGKVARHLNGEHRNNAAVNLAYGSQLENISDKQRHGTQTRGSAHGPSKLTERDVAIIKSLPRKHQADIGAAFGVSSSNVSAIQLGKSWRHV